MMSTLSQPTLSAVHAKCSLHGFVLLESICSCCWFSFPRAVTNQVKSITIVSFSQNEEKLRCRMDTKKEEGKGRTVECTVFIMPSTSIRRCWRYSLFILDRVAVSTCVHHTVCARIPMLDVPEVVVVGGGVSYAGII